MSTESPETMSHLPEVARLRDIVARLRAPGGCPWDREQTHASLRASAIEEVYEMVEAIDAGDDPHFKEELGDLLLQVIMHAQIAGEQGRFGLEEIAAEVAEKLVRRHPHVFGEEASRAAGNRAAGRDDHAISAQVGGEGRRLHDHRRG